jgi:dolichyl-phosphate beta-glucosyltransferase
MRQLGGERSTPAVHRSSHAGEASVSRSVVHELDLVRPDERWDVPAQLDLVVPALNEEARIGTTVEALADRCHTGGWPMPVRLVVVDNGSVDGTSEAVDLARRANLPVKVISCQTRGKGAAVRAGVLFATAPYVGYCDADLSTPTSAIGQGMQLLEAGWDVVIGSRRCLGAGYLVRQPALRRAGSAAFHAMASRLVPSASDTQCGFKMFRTSVAQELFAPATVDGFAFDVELLARATRQSQLTMIEMPIRWTDQEGSSFRPLADGLRSFQDLREVRRALRASPTGDRSTS